MSYSEWQLQQTYYADPQVAGPPTVPAQGAYHYPHSEIVAPSEHPHTSYDAYQYAGHPAQPAYAYDPSPSYGTAPILAPSPNASTPGSATESSASSSSYPRSFDGMAPGLPGVPTAHSSTNSAHSASSTAPPGRANPVFEGNILFWTSADPRETLIWGEEPVLDDYRRPLIQKDGKPKTRSLQYSLNTPDGYMLQTKTFIQSTTGSKAEFWWVTRTELGQMIYRGHSISMTQYVQPGSSPSCTRFTIPEDRRMFEWSRDAQDADTFTLYSLPNRKVYAHFIAGPFESADLFPYVRYHWTNDEPLLFHSILAITIRRWAELYRL